MLKKGLSFLLFLIVIVGAVVLTSNYIEKEESVFAENNLEENKNGSITVTGSYSEKVKPDIAYVQINVNTKDKDAEVAQKANDTKMNAVITKLKNLGLEEKNIKTTNYSMNPTYEWKEVEETVDGKIVRKSERYLTGYEVRNTIRVTVEEMNRVGKVLDLAISEDVSNTNMISFGLSDSLKEEKYLEALKKAAQKAENKAKSLASIYSITLDKPYSVIESGSKYIEPIQIRDSYMDLKVMNESSGAQIMTGELEVSANITVIYKY